VLAGTTNEQVNEVEVRRLDGSSQIFRFVMGIPAPARHAFLVFNESLKATSLDRHAEETIGLQNASHLQHCAHKIRPGQMVQASNGLDCIHGTCSDG